MKRNRHILQAVSLFMVGFMSGWQVPHQSSVPAKLHHLPIVSHVLEKEGFTVIYDGRSKAPYCVVEVLTLESLAGSADRAKHRFKEDNALLPHLRATLADYKGSGLDRGHMAAAANHKANEEVMGESFLLSNMCPQEPAFNRGYWSHFEQHARDLTHNYKNVILYTGPLYLPQGVPGMRFVHYPVIGPNDVAVPTHFFKVLKLEHASGVVDTRAYILPNERIASDTAVESFQVTLEKLESLSGILF